MRMDQHIEEVYNKYKEEDERNASQDAQTSVQGKELQWSETENMKDKDLEYFGRVEIASSGKTTPIPVCFHSCYL